MEPINVVVCGASNGIARHLVLLLSEGLVFGQEQPINLRLNDSPGYMNPVDGLLLETQDLACPLFREIIATDDLDKAFENADVAFLLEAVHFGEESWKRKYYLCQNRIIFRRQAQAIEKTAHKHIKIIIVDIYANTNAFFVSQYAPSIPKKNITTVTRLNQNRAQVEIAARLNVQVDNVKNVIIWGNKLGQYPDAKHSTVLFPSGEKKNVRDEINDEWLDNDFITLVRKHVITAMKEEEVPYTSSIAKAAADHMRDWWFGTKPGQWTSMGVLSDGSYGIPKNIFFSFPVTIKDKQYEIVKNLEISDFAQSKLDIIKQELLEEHNEAVSLIQKDTHYMDLDDSELDEFFTNKDKYYYTAGLFY